MTNEAIVTWQHVEIFLAGSTGLSLVAHAVDTFPTPANQYGQWLLGLIKFFVGQRQGAKNALAGNDTVTVAVPQGTGNGTGQSTETVSKKTEVTPEAITTATEKVTKTEVSVPNPNPTDTPKP